jgi:hypothetical protein
VYDCAAKRGLYWSKEARMDISVQIARTTAQLTTALSDPTQGMLWFSWRTPNSAFPHPSAFLGNYSGIAVSPSGGAAGFWADMRLSTCFGVSCGKSEDAFYASAP